MAFDSQRIKLHTLHSMELISPARRHADVAYIACLHYVVKSLHSFFDGSIVIKTMALEDIDVVKLEALQAMFDGFEYMLATEAMLIDVAHRIRVCSPNQAFAGCFGDGEKNLCQNDNLIAGEVELFDCFAQDNLGRAIRVYVSGIKCIDSGIVAAHYVLSEIDAYRGHR
jgi:hypothetical protein